MDPSGRNFDEHLDLAFEDQIGGAAGVALAHDQIAGCETGDAAACGERAQRCPIELGEGRI